MGIPRYREARNRPARRNGGVNPAARLRRPGALRHGAAPRAALLRLDPIRRLLGKPMPDRADAGARHRAGKQAGSSRRPVDSDLTRVMADEPEPTGLVTAFAHLDALRARSDDIVVDPRPRSLGWAQAMQATTARTKSAANSVDDIENSVPTSVAAAMTLSASIGNPLVTTREG